MAPHDGLLVEHIANDWGRHIKVKSKPKVVLSQDGDTWKLTEPVASRAVQSNVRSMLDSLTKVEFKEAVGSGADKFQGFDLDGAKAIRVQVFQGATKTLDVYFGKSGSKGQ